ncbi:hypothetical protein HPB50_015897 [Hyalomma asiaticum]|uniref:Uncharacterized protein n=1 Tax=Hyalomma asiaticum TaxID=266040 RepID=A0ACB7SHX3_HYAAI|nr:hypothetical protein HPB50_015897 [Hyalomma asiaticum]
MGNRQCSGGAAIGAAESASVSVLRNIEEAASTEARVDSAREIDGGRGLPQFSREELVNRDFTYKVPTKKLEQQISHSDGLVFTIKCKGAVHQEAKSILARMLLRRHVVTLDMRHDCQSVAHGLPSAVRGGALSQSSQPWPKIQTSRKTTSVSPITKLRLLATIHKIVDKTPTEEMDRALSEGVDCLLRYQGESDGLDEKKVLRPVMEHFKSKDLSLVQSDKKSPGTGMAQDYPVITSGDEVD